MRITALRLDEFGVGRYRISNPLSELEKRGHFCQVIQAEYGLRMRSDWFIGDILLCQRMNDQVIYDLVASIPAHCRPKVVYEVDDLLWNDPNPKGGKELAADWQRTVPPMLRRADAVVCSTPELEVQCQEFNRNTYVVRNGIDFGLRDWNSRINRTPEMEGKIIIGWSGSGWHEGDLDVTGKALRRTMLKYPNTFLCLQGDAPNIALWVQGLRIPKKRMCIIGWMPFDQHPSVFSLFDIGIAPLSNTLYNRCKSELKLMEFGASGLPYVASNVAPYRRFHNLAEGKCGFLASTEDSWSYSLESLVISEEKRLEKGAAGSEFVHEKYSLNNQTDELETALKDILKSDNQGTVRPTLRHAAQH